MDMLVNLYALPEETAVEGVRIMRVLPPDGKKVLDWVGAVFSEGWVSECTAALCQQPPTCFIAQRDGAIIGFACYDATARGYFGPIGVAEDERGGGIGRALLIRCLHGMREAGYGYAVIGWCDEAQRFYRGAVGAIPIPDSAPGQTAYGRMTRFSRKDAKA